MVNWHPLNLMILVSCLKIILKILRDLCTRQLEHWKENHFPILCIALQTRAAVKCGGGIHVTI